MRINDLRTILFILLTLDACYRSICGSTLVGARYLSMETNTSLSASLLARPTESEWNRRYASTPQAPQSSPCKTLKLMPWGTFVRATSFCYNGLVSFESCRKQLMMSDNCNGLIYTDWDIFKGRKFLWWRRGMGTCKLFDRSDTGVQVLVRGGASSGVLEPFDNNSYVVLKTVPAFDNCTARDSASAGGTEKPVNEFSLQSYKACLSTAASATEYRSTWSNTKWHYATSAELQQLVPLHIVIFVTETWVEQHTVEVDTISSHFQCYADAHGYRFTLSVSSPLISPKLVLKRTIKPRVLCCFSRDRSCLR